MLQCEVYRASCSVRCAPSPQVFGDTKQAKQRVKVVGEPVSTEGVQAAIARVEDDAPLSACGQWDSVRVACSSSGRS